MSFITLPSHSALRSPAYRSWLAALFVSGVGTWGQALAEAWFAYRLSHSAALLGLIAFAGQLPFLLLGPWAGSLADRLDQRRIVTCAQLINCLQALALAAFYYSGSTHLSILIGLVVLQGCAITFDAPARQGLVLRLLQCREQHPSAIGLNQTIFGLTRLIGPSAAGLLIAVWGEGACFLVNALSFLPLLGLLQVVRPTPHPARPRRATYRDAVCYVREHRELLDVLGFMAAMSLLLWPFSSELAAYADEVLKAQAATVGLLQAVVAAGGVVAATMIGAFSHRWAHFTLVRVCLVGAALGEVLLSRVHTAALAVPLLVIMGLTITGALVASNQLVQREVPEGLRGRVSSLYFIAVMGPMPFGALGLGLLAQQVGVPSAFLLDAVFFSIALGILTRLRERRLARALPPTQTPGKSFLQVREEPLQ